MTKIYIIALLSLVTTSCSKDFLKDYDSRIVGTWNLIDVDRRGIGGSLNNLTYIEGEFIFRNGGEFTYTNNAGIVYRGGWNISRYWQNNGCSTDDDGNTSCDEREVRTLMVTAIDPTGQDIKTENFEEIIFTGTDRFKAYIYSGLHRYVFHFRR